MFMLKWFASLRLAENGHKHQDECISGWGRRAADYYYRKAARESLRSLMGTRGVPGTQYLNSLQLIDNRTRIHLPIGRTAPTTLGPPGQNDGFFGRYTRPKQLLQQAGTSAL